MLNTSTKQVVRDPGGFDWWRVAGQTQDHAFRVVGAWMSSACPNRVRWTAAATPCLFGPTDACIECLAIVSPESEQRALDGNR